MVHGARVRLDRDAVGRLQLVKVERRKERHQRGRRGLMAPDLQPVPVGTNVVGVMDGPRGKPEGLLLERLKVGETI